MTKSEDAFTWTVERLARHAEMNGEHLYMWSFTFKKRLHDWQYGRLYMRFMLDIVDEYKLETPLLGVRVVERHPGGHGLHYHAIVNKRMAIQWVNRVGDRYGIGHCWVKQCWGLEGLSKYLGGYLRKDERLPRGCRRWGTIGGWNHCRVNMVERKSSYTESMKLVRECWAGGRVPLSVVRDVYASPVVGDLRWMKWACDWAVVNGDEGFDVFKRPLWWFQQQAPELANDLDGRCPF